MTRRIMSARLGWPHQRTIIERPRKVGAADAVTLVRLIAALAVLALPSTGVLSSVHATYLSLAIFWIGDALDGIVARLLDRETVHGANLDIIADRISVLAVCASVYLNFPGHALSSVLFAIHFTILDFAGVVQFARLQLGSPNYFFLVSERIFATNWDWRAKLVSQIPFGVMVFCGDSLWAVAVLLACAVWKGASAIAITRIAAPKRDRM